MLSIENVSKKFGDTPVLNSLSFTVNEGEFLTLLGSSGCGKTTTLRIIAGIESPDNGKILLNDKDITELAPNKRDVNTVFQNYALFPHMNIEQNIGYSLKLRGMKKADIKQKVFDMLDLVRLSGYEKRMPTELSGGQKQRVAIARSLIAEPKVLLLDEPLGALDLQLRREMQIELKRLQQKLGISFVYITHDQEEAINMSDRIAVMREGTFEQIGTPAEIYDSPRTAYVAKFVGNANIICGTAQNVGDFVSVKTSSGTVKVARKNFSIKDGDSAVFAIRSEQIELLKEEKNGLKATVTQKSFNGGMLRITAQTADEEIVASRHGINSDISVGDEIFVNFAPENAVLVEAK
ncbi:MAG: ABC transporter ATP-binding protein [Clostridia bacterium]